MFFVSNINKTISVKTVLKELVCSFGPHLKVIGICYYEKVLNVEKKEHKYRKQKKLSSERTFFHKQNISFNVISIAIFKIDIRASRWVISMMKIGYKLTNITT